MKYYILIIVLCIVLAVIYVESERGVSACEKKGNSRTECINFAN